MRWLPQSLFGRLALILFGGLLVAQLLSAVINPVESGSHLGLDPRRRTADPDHLDRPRSRKADSKRR